MNFSNLTPLNKVEALRVLDARIKIEVSNKLADGMPENVLRYEFERALAQVESQFTPVECGSLLGVLDRAIEDFRNELK